jgi:predicted O-methyltransferase YrrM
MVSSFAGRLVRGLARVLHALHLYWIARWIVNHLPPRMRLGLSKLQLRLGYMQGLELVPEGELEKTFGAALRYLGKDSAEAPAVYLEFGVYIGTSLACMYKAATDVGASKLRIIGFDSFEGMPEGVEKQDGSHWHKGELFSDLALTRRNLTRLGVPLERVELVPGWFEDSLTEATRTRLGIGTADIVMVDCVIASATTVALDFLLPLITDRTIVFFDDWAILDLEQRDLGEKAAFEAWLLDHPEVKAEHLPSIIYSPNARSFVLTRAGAGPSVASGLASTTAL